MNDPFRDPALARQRRRVGLWALVAKALLLAVLVGAWWWWEQARTRAQSGAAGAPVTPAASTLAAAHGPAMAPPLARAAASALQAGTPQAVAEGEAAGDPAAKPGRNELCGVGLIEAGKEPAHLFAHAEAAGWPRILAALESSPAERARAAAWVLRYWLPWATAVGRGEAAPPETDARQSLALMAMNSPDPGIFRWAWALCQFRDAPPSCGQLSVLGMVERDIEDAAHWLPLAQAQPAMALPALQGVLHASAFSPFPSLTPWVESALPADLAPYLRANLLGQSMRWGQALEAVMNEGTLAVARPCLAADSDRLACGALADVLASRAPDLLGLHLAGRIGELHGWQPQRVQALRDQLERLQQASDIGPVDAAPWSCANVERSRRFLSDRATYGEVEALRRLGAAAGAPAAAPR